MATVPGFIKDEDNAMAQMDALVDIMKSFSK